MITADDILNDLDGITYRQALAAGLSDKKALACVEAVAKCLCLNYPNRSYAYVPTLDWETMEARNERIWEQFSGRNYVELAIEYKMSVQQIYAIIKVQRAINVKRRQRDLFPVDDAELHRACTLYNVMTNHMPHELTLVGLNGDKAMALCLELYNHLRAVFPGVSFRVTEAMWMKRKKAGSFDLFSLDGLSEAEAI